MKLTYLKDMNKNTFQGEIKNSNQNIFTSNKPNDNSSILSSKSKFKNDLNSNHHGK